MNIKRIVIMTVVLAIAAMGLSTPAFAEVEKEAYASASIMSNYVWRGQKLSESVVLQPNAGLSYNGFGFDLWANYDFDTDEANETDFTLSYSTSMGKLGLGGGWIYYMLDGIEDTQELYVEASYDVILSPSVTFYYDIVEGGGGFLVAALGHSFPIGDYSLDVGASASVNFENEVMGDFTDFYNGEVTLGTSIPVGPVSIAPMIALTFPLSDDAEDAIEAVSFDEDSTTFYGGVAVSLSF